MPTTRYAHDLDCGRVTPLTAVILAAGAGSRLGELGKHYSKPMVPVAGRPLVGWVVRMLRAAGVQRLIFVGHPTDSLLADFVAAQSDAHLVCQAERRGIADALRLALPSVGQQSYLACACDSLYRAVEVSRLIAIGQSRPNTAAVGVLEMGVEATVSRSAVTIDAHGGVTDLVEKPPPGSTISPFVALPLYWLPPAFAACCTDTPESHGESYVTTVLRRFLQRGGQVQAVPLTRRIEVTTPPDIAAAEVMLGSDADWFRAP